MPQVSFTQNLKRHVDCPAVQASGATVAEVLSQIFANNPRLRAYVLDEQGELRKHMIVFRNGEPLRDRRRLSDAVEPSDEIVVMQALSGG
jgi:sulfur carrier protein ThiS